MKLSKNYKSIFNIVASYKSKLSAMGDEGFQLTPPIGGWSYSEVYSHIFDSSLLSIMAIQKCLAKEGEIKPTPFAAKLILFFGMLPPGKRYKAPSRLADRVKKITITAAEQFITDFELQLAKIYPHIANADLKIKVKHPRLSYLNAKQWLRFIEVHLKHHLKQLQSIQNSFQQQA
jgi:hypothetical protein